MNEAEIGEFAQNLIQFNSLRTKEQKTDQSYYNDDFDVRIPAPFHIIRTGSAARIVDNIVNHIETVNPQVSVHPKKTTQKSRESANKVSRFLNVLVRKIRPEITEALWNAALRGEGIFQIQFNNDAYKKNGKNYVYTGDEMPVIVTAPDPLIVFTWPYDVFLPEQVVKSFDMIPMLVHKLYPTVVKPKDKEALTYMAYFDAQQKYFKVDDYAVDGGLKTNILKFCPFVHFYAGFGKRSPSGEPETLAVGRLRKIRNILVEECEVESRIDSIIALYANPIVQIEQIALDAGEADLEQLKKMVIGPGQTVVTPFGYKQTIYTPEVATAQLFAHLGSIKQRLGLEDPPLLSGAGYARASGRQEDIEYGIVQKKHAKLVQNLEMALSLTLGRVLQVLDTVPQALPITVIGETTQDGERVVKEDTINKEDIDGYYECTVKLNPEEAVENDRNFMKHRILVNEGRESWKRFIVEGMGKTEDEADEIIAETLAEQAVRDDPMMRAARTQEALERMGMQRFIKKAQEDTEMQRRLQEGLKEYEEKGEGQYRPTEARNPAAMDIVRQLMGGETPQGIKRSPQMMETQNV